MGNVVSQKCPTCGAPLPVRKGLSDVTCTYCGNSIHIEWAKKAPTQADPRTLYVSPQGNTAAIFIAATAAVGVMVTGIAVFAINSASPQAKFEQVVAAVPKIGGQSRVESFPVTCGLNQTLEIVDQTYEGKGPLIVGAINCKIKIKNSKLKSDVVVAAKNLTEITVEGSTLEGTETAIEMEMNAKLFAKGKSTIKGKEAAIDSGSNCTVELTDSTVEGDEVGIRAGLNFKLKAHNATIKGREAAITGDTNLTVEMRDSTISANTIGLEADSNLSLDMRGGLIQANEAAVRCSKYNGKLKLTHGAKLAAKEVALDGGTNLELTLDGAKIEGGEIGVAGGTNAHLELRDQAKISGKEFAAKLSGNAEVEVRNSTLDSKGIALCGAYNAEIEARGATVNGAEALAFMRKPRKLELGDSKITGKQNFSSRKCQ